MKTRCAGKLKRYPDLWFLPRLGTPVRWAVHSRGHGLGYRVSPLAANHASGFLLDTKEGEGAGAKATAPSTETQRCSSSSFLQTSTSRCQTFGPNLPVVPTPFGSTVGLPQVFGMVRPGHLDLAPMLSPLVAVTAAVVVLPAAAEGRRGKTGRWWNGACSSTPRWTRQVCSVGRLPSALRNQARRGIC